MSAGSIIVLCIGMILIIIPVIRFKNRQKFAANSAEIEATVSRIDVREGTICSEGSGSRSEDWYPVYKYTVGGVTYESDAGQAYFLPQVGEKRIVLYNKSKPEEIIIPVHAKRFTGWELFFLVLGLGSIICAFILPAEFWRELGEAIGN